MNEIPDAVSQESEDAIKSIMDAHGYDGLTETQSQAFSQGALDDGNTLLVAETGNGKTLVAEARLKQALDAGKRAVYLVPSYQLTQSKQSELSEWMETFRAATGAGSIRSADVPVMTFESFFQAVMRDIGGIRSFDLAIFDDFHEIYGSHRGAGIEKAMTACLDQSIDVFAMSATLGNPAELSEWLDATLIESESSRSIPVVEHPIEDNPSQTKGEQIANLVEDNEENAPFIVFNNRRDWAESRAEEIADTGLFTDVSDRRFTEEVERAVPAEMTDKYEKLAELMESGVAFHHSGLASPVRDLIVDAVKKGDLRCISATPGLAYGFDAPINSVVVADLKRFGGWIGVYEYIQWIGRSARPGYGFDQGNAYPMYKTERAAERFQFGTPAQDKEIEDVSTHIESEAAFSQLLLELIDFGWDTPDEIEDFLKNSLYWKQLTGNKAWAEVGHSGVERQMQRKLRETTNWLERNSFIEEHVASEGFSTTDKGDAAIEFIYETWIDTPLKDISRVEQDLPGYVDRPFDLVKLVAKHFDRATLRNCPDNDHSFAGYLYNNGESTSDADKTAGVICWYWAQGRDLDQLEDELDVDLTSLPSTARDIRDLLEALKHLLKVSETVTEPNWYNVFIDQVQYGVPATDIVFANQVDNLGRKRIGALRTTLNTLPATNPSNPLREQLQNLYEETDRQQFIDVLKGNVSGIGDATAKNLARHVETIESSQKTPQPPFNLPNDSNASTGSIDNSDTNRNGFTKASKLDDFN